MIEDLKLLPEKTSHQQGHTGLYEENYKSDSVEKNPGIVRPSCVESSSAVADASENRFTTKPLIHPARFQVRKRRFSISSATAALSLAGNGWNLGSNVTEKANGHVTNDGRCSNPFLNCEYLPDKRSTSPNLHHRFSSAQEEGSDHFVMNSRSHVQLGDTNRLMSQGLNSTPVKESQNLSGINLSDKTTHSHHQTQSPPTLGNQCQPQPTGLSHGHIHGNQTLPPRKGVSCPLVALIIISLTTNVVLLLVLFVYVYKPNVAVPVNL